MSWNILKPALLSSFLAYANATSAMAQAAAPELPPENVFTLAFTAASCRDDGGVNAVITLQLRHGDEIQGRQHVFSEKSALQDFVRSMQKQIPTPMIPTQENIDEVWQEVDHAAFDQDCESQNKYPEYYFYINENTFCSQGEPVVSVDYYIKQKGEYISGRFGNFSAAADFVENITKMKNDNPDYTLPDEDEIKTLSRQVTAALIAEFRCPTRHL